MKWLFNEEHIVLETEEIQKVSNFFEKEFGITNIEAIKATTDCFEIVRLQIPEKEAIETISVQRFKAFAE